MKDKSILKEEIQNVLEKRNINEYIDTYFEEKRDYSNDEEYRELKYECDKLSNQLQEKLSISDREKLDRLKGIIHEIEGIDTRIAYKIGLIEGITITNEIHNNR